MKLKVIEAWDEPHLASLSGDQPEGSLHYEGSTAEVTTSDVIMTVIIGSF